MQGGRRLRWQGIMGLIAGRMMGMRHGALACDMCSITCIIMSLSHMRSISRYLIYIWCR